jgi:hypothetical protein
MTTIEHSVAPEDVMALLDGELPAAEARVVSAHLESCAQCATLAEELRSTSRSLSRWSVPAVSDEIEDSIMDRSAEVAAGRKITKPKAWFPSGFWNWKLMASGGVVAMALLVLVVFSRTLNRPSPVGEAVVIGSVDGNLKGPAVGEPLYSQAPRPSGGIAGKGSVGQLLQAPAAGVNAKVEKEDGPPVHDNSGFFAKPESADRFSGGGLEQLGAGSMSQQNQSKKFDRLDQFAKLQAPPAPMIARVVSLTIVVKDVDAARSSLDLILGQHHGYSAQLSASTPGYGARSLQSSLRIPADELQTAVAAIKMLGRVENESQSGEEVSQQHADLVARLKTARETEARYRDILQQRTGKISDVLEVEQSIARVRGEIEGMEAEQKTLEHRVDFATVEVQLAEEYKARFDSPAASVSTQIHNAFVAGYRNATGSLLGLVLFIEEYGPSLVIWLVILGLPVVLVWRRYRRIRSAI